MYIFDEANVCQYPYKGNVKWYLCVSMIHDLVFMDKDTGTMQLWGMEVVIMDFVWLNCGKQLIWMFIMNKAYSGNYIWVISLVFIGESILMIKYGQWCWLQY